MMNKRIRSMIDDIFSEMKMTAENLALRDELMANAQARYEDVIASGGSEEAAFAQVAASLEDVYGLLHEMNRMDEEKARPKQKEFVWNPETPEKTQAPQREPFVWNPVLGDEGEAHTAPEAAEVSGEPEMPEAAEAPEAQTAPEIDLGDTLNRAFSALGTFGKSIMPQAKKLARDMDDVTGGALTSVGKAVNKGMKDAQKAAGDMIDKMSDKSGELTFDFGRREEPKTPEAQEPIYCGPVSDAPETTGDSIVLEESHKPLLDEDGDVNEDAFIKVVEQIERDAKKILGDAAESLHGAAQDEPAADAEFTVNGEKTAEGSVVFPAAGLHEIDVELDADDVKVEVSSSDRIEVIWSAKNVEGEPQTWMEGHTLKIRRKNPDVFKTFFSVFSKDGGMVTVRVPHGYAADYRISTTSGDIYLDEIDVDSVRANTTSGSIRLEPDASVRADLVKADSVSGSVTISACANDVKCDGISGRKFISCDAVNVDVDTVSGAVHVEGACETWKVDAVSGNVELLCTVVPSGKIDIDTVSATARVALPGEIRGFVADLSTMSGRIVNEFGPNRYGTCALPIHMDSMSGSLMITRL